MTKKFSLFFVFCFLAVQVLSVLHIADYGVSEHEHHGQLCDIYLHGEQAKASAPAAEATLTLPVLAFYAIAQHEAPLLWSQGYSDSSPRAPPFYS